jgi:hypothetical protein
MNHVLGPKGCDWHRFASQRVTNIQKKLRNISVLWEQFYMFLKIETSKVRSSQKIFVVTYLKSCCVQRSNFKSTESGSKE